MKKRKTAKSDVSEEVMMESDDLHEARLRHIHCVSVPDACIVCCEETGQVAIGDDEPQALEKMRTLLERKQTGSVAPHSWGNITLAVENICGMFFARHRETGIVVRAESELEAMGEITKMLKTLNRAQ